MFCDLELVTVLSQLVWNQSACCDFLLVSSGLGFHVFLRKSRHRICWVLSSALLMMSWVAWRVRRYSADETSLLAS